MAYSADLFGSYDPSLITMTLAWILCAVAVFVVRPPARNALGPAKKLAR
jgi:hypothetical protein